VPLQVGATVLLVVVTESGLHPEFGLTLKEQVGGSITQIVLVAVEMVEQLFFAVNVIV
jgi:hypothetical protein